MKRSTMSLISAFATIALAATTMQQATAQTGEEPADISPPSDDISQLADDAGLSQEEAQQRSEGEEEFLDALATAKDTAEEQYFSSAWTPADESSTGHKAWVSFKGEVSDDVRGLFNDLPFSVEVREDAQHSESELEDIREEVMRDLYEAGDLDGLTGDFTEEGGLHIQYEPSDSLSPHSADFNNFTTLVESIEDDSELNITIERSEDSVPVEEAVRGGEKTVDCTTGFGVEGASNRGAITAGHCNNDPGVPTGSA